MVYSTHGYSATLEVKQIFRLPKEPYGSETEIFADDLETTPSWGDVTVDKGNEYHPDLRMKETKRMAPLQVIQPQGPSFTISNNTIDWLGWKFSVGFNYVCRSLIWTRCLSLTIDELQREGLTLHNMTYDGRNTFYRLSLSEYTVLHC